MHNSVAPLTPHLPSNDHGIPNSLPGVHRENKNRDPDPAADALSGPVNFLSDTYYLPNASAGLIDWETTPPWTLGVTSPSSQEPLEGTGVFDASPSCSSSYFGLDLPPTAYELVSQTIGRPALPHPIGKMTNMLADNGPFGFLAEIECQSIPGMICTDQSPSGPSSALDRDGFTAWSGPGHTRTSDHCDRSSFGLLSSPLETASVRRSTKSAPEYVEAAQKSQPVFSLFPISWIKIPQRKYTQKKGYRPSSQPGKVTFSVNNTCGFNMQNAFCQLFTGLSGRDDPVLENANSPVSCRLLFPGYPINARCSQIAVKNWRKERAPITKSKLAYEIAKRVKQYLDASATISIDPSTDARWTIGQGCMRLEKMYLVNVTWVSKGSLQPEIWVDNS